MFGPIMEKIVILTLFVPIFAFKEPNPPNFPDNVGIFDENTVTEAKLFANRAFSSNGGNCNHGQFSNLHYAMLFKPGVYDIDIPVGYYTQVKL